MRNKMKRFGKRVLLPAMAATIMTMASVSTKVYALMAARYEEPAQTSFLMPPEETEAVLQP